MDHIKVYKEESAYYITIEVKHSETKNQSSSLSLSIEEAKELLAKLHNFIYHDKEHT